MAVCVWLCGALRDMSNTTHTRYVFSKFAPTCECCEWFEDVNEHNSTIPTPPACTAWAADLEANEKVCVSLSLHVDTQADSSGMGEVGAQEGIHVADHDDCIHFWNCFSAEGGAIGTDRWAYILIQVSSCPQRDGERSGALALTDTSAVGCGVDMQGIALGIVLDVVQINVFVWITTKLTVRAPLAAGV